ncbi:MAG: signal recognition particle-docking protein FtsY [Ruminococcus sp.]|nr:signal recognition particle-docking protein FtsY [Ruminococcus sp.]
MGFFDKLKAGLSKTKNGLMSGINSLFKRGNLDDDFYDELEELLILSDLGGKTSEEIVDSLRERVKENKIKDPMEARQALKDIITEMLGEDVPLNLSTKPSVILVIGVNGAGKTTTIGKLSYQLKNEGKKVLVAAADTFRAAAVDQLQVWCDRAGVDIIKHAEGSDPAAVVFDAMDAAKARNVDVVIVDTAGRLQTKKNLMAELSKISRIVHSKAEDCALEVLIALDATTGQNAVNQAREFNEAADITGIILTKLDSTAKGGIVIPIVNELKVPVKIVTVGEKIDDIQPFVAKDFVDALFDEGGESQ